ncbi:MAG: hypothetical protein ACE5HE_06455 [Phycisphaerae bacterium]
MSIPNLSLAKQMAMPAYQQVPATGGIPSAGGAAFQIQPPGAGAASRNAQVSGAAQADMRRSGAGAIESSIGATKLHDLVDPSKIRDPWKRFEALRSWLLERMDDPSEITNKDLIAFQLLAQDATRTLELTTKVAEHATSGVKTVLQTQA